MVRTIAVVALLSFVGGEGFAQTARVPVISPAERAAIFKAGGAVLRGGKWLGCADAPSPEPATIDLYKDLNGDGRPEAVVTSYGTYCYGMTGQGYALLSKQPNGGWRMMDGGQGIPEFLATKGAGGWPDISIGGPGFCFPVVRWNGKEYAIHRHQYEGKACRPNR
ncbi:hypothetical protein BSL82_06880 [Tardibacter chloracetimidivorans]|uniref:Uncharacterized protein n=1 Tax=Tardibacter chloracetimidivorans TaxID=1921510 RepID=A0A1L3ZTV1_9SPHN|nr:hypothetical protein [Tardibacter chloracetimidivorans]API59064.1 hypothetical protein BSL82_06880 [Tardibacter chloracetimidivorans]